ncbi:MAG: thiol-disulfide oxidoreductase DCC family protein [bacterium]
MSTPIILFDGVCHLCNASVNFILDRDKKQIFKVAALQSEPGQDLLTKLHFPKPDKPEIPNFNSQIPKSLPKEQGFESLDTKNYLDTIILLENGNFFSASTAILRIVKRLPLPWYLLYAFIIIPTFIRDPVYRFIARHRYKWFGKSEKCRVPTPEIQERFL